MTPRRTSLLLVPAAIVLTAAGCGGGGSSERTVPKPQAKVLEQGPFGRGADQVWIFRPRARARSIVVFVHGAGDRAETTPRYHRPWLEHLAVRGSIVLYPRYELAHAPDALRHLVAGVRTGESQLDNLRLPVLEIGYSRGARLAVEYAALAGAVGLVPKAVLSIFPSTLVPPEPLLDLRGIDPRTRILILVGDRDSVVADVGARELRSRLDAAGFPRERAAIQIVHSRPGFTANHLSVLSTTAGAKAAYWSRADRLLVSLTSVRRSR